MKTLRLGEAKYLSVVTEANKWHRLDLNLASNVSLSSRFMATSTCLVGC